MILPQSVCIFGMESARNLRSVQRGCAKKQRQKMKERKRRKDMHSDQEVADRETRQVGGTNLRTYEVFNK